jgi:hypothetical protein
MASTLRISDELKARSDAYAGALGITLNALVAVALRDYLDARDPGRPGRVVQQQQPAGDPPSPDKSYVGCQRNSPCPCGSGRKYKHCHGAAGDGAAT